MPIALTYPHDPSARLLNAGTSPDFREVAGIVQGIDKPKLVAWEREEPDWYGECNLSLPPDAQVSEITWASDRTDPVIIIFYHALYHDGMQCFTLLHASEASSSRPAFHVVMLDASLLWQLAPGMQDPTWIGQAAVNPADSSAFLFTVAERSAPTRTRIYNFTVSSVKQAPGTTRVQAVEVPVGSVQNPACPSWTAGGQAILLQGSSWSRKMTSVRVNSPASVSPQVWIEQRPTWEPSWGTDMYEVTYPAANRPGTIAVDAIYANSCCWPVGLSLPHTKKYQSAFVFVAQMNQKKSGIWLYSAARTVHEITYDELISVPPLVHVSEGKLCIATINAEPGDRYGTLRYRVTMRTIKQEEIDAPKTTLMDLLHELHIV